MRHIGLSFTVIFTFLTHFFLREERLANPEQG